MVNVYVSGVSIDIGRQLENEAREIYFDLSGLEETYGQGTATLVHMRPSDAAPYICTTRVYGQYLVWTVTDTDTAYAGAGKCELRWVVGETLAKSIIYTTTIAPSITGAEEVPSPYQSWYDALVSKIDEYVIAENEISELSANIAANTSDIAVLDGRMDEFTRLPDGSTTGDAELADIRVGADGTQYATAGDAVREQVSHLSALKDGNLPLKLIKNSYVKRDGSFAVYNNWSRTDYIPCDNYKYLTISSSVASSYNAFYDENKGFLQAFNVSQGTNRIATPGGACYFVLSNTTAAMETTVVDYFNLKTAFSMTQRIGIYSGILYSGTAKNIEIKASGTDLIVDIPAQSYVEHANYYGQLLYTTLSAGQTITVSNGNYLVCRSSNNSCESMTFAQIRALSASELVTIIFRNQYGYPLGIGNQIYLDHNLPEYYRQIMATKTDTINNIKASVGLDGGFSFVFITDEHVVQNRMKSPQLIKYIKEKTNIDVIINGGDIVTKRQTKAEVYKDISEFVSAMTDQTGCTMYSAIGNHEFNNPNMSQSEADLAITLTLSEVSAFLYSGSNYSNGCVFDTATMAYYKDFGDLRLFFLPCNYGSGVYRNAVWWIMDQMQSLPTDYHFAVVSHVINEWAADMSTSTTKARVDGLLNAMDALKNRQTFTYETRTFDYTNSTAEPICMIGGHAHVDYDFVTTGGIPVIMTTCDANVQESGGLTRTSFTQNEQAFDVVTFDYNNRKITLTRIGAGSDREFTY